METLSAEEKYKALKEEAEASGKSMPSFEKWKEEMERKHGYAGSKILMEPPRIQKQSGSDILRER